MLINQGYETTHPNSIYYRTGNSMDIAFKYFFFQNNFFQRNKQDTISIQLFY